MTNAQPRDSLSKLIRDRMAERGMTYDDVCRQAAQRGYRLGKSTLHALVSKPEHRQTPRAHTIEAIAAGLGYPKDVLLEAAAEQAGYRLVDIPTTLESAGTLRIIAAVHEELTADQRRELAAMVEKYAEEMKRGEE